MFIRRILCFRDRQRASPLNITIVQVYEPASSYDDNEVDAFYRELQSLVDQTTKQDILVVQSDWHAEVGEDAQEDWREVCGPSCNPETNDRAQALRLRNLQQPCAGKYPRQP